VLRRNDIVVGKTVVPSGDYILIESSLKLKSQARSAISVQTTSRDVRQTRDLEWP